MKQLKFGTILKLATDLQKAGVPAKEILEMPIYIGDDDELNGIHTAWYVQMIDPEAEDHADFVELINSSRGNKEITKWSILIS